MSNPTIAALIDATAIISLSKRKNPAALLESIDRALVSGHGEEVVAWLASLAALRLGKKRLLHLVRIVAEQAAAEFDEDEL